ncbi:TolC family protein [Flavobacteriaceae bacterium 14752]|uniref:TolC family protein n=1 Tax=Mesohalobacter salilacus TaxID=2491711 RepID=UPI000F642F85|nr:TolC family protein [Flavobacteriaceae bacterium 14752]
MKKLILIILCFSFSQGFSQESEAKIQWTLEACIKHAFENNISIKQSQLNIEDADINKSDAVGNFLPSLNLNASNSWNSGLTQNVVTGVLENQVTRNFSTGATVGINVFSGLQNWRTLQRAKLSQLASQYSLEQMEDDIALFIANAYLQVLVSKQTLAVLEEQNLITQQQIDQTQALIEAGTVPEGDILELQATNADEQQQIIVAKNDVKISLISLAQALLIKDYENFDIADESYDIPITDIMNRDIGEIIEEAKKERYEVLVAEKDVEIAQKNVEIARGAYYPTLRGFFNYNTRESDRERFVSAGVDPNDPTRQIGFVEDTGAAVVTPNFLTEAIGPRDFVDQLWRNDGISYGLQLNIPVFNGFATRNNVKRSQINLERSKNQLQQAELDLEADVYQAYVDAQGAAKAYDAAVKSVQAQQNAYDFAKERFDVGMSNAFDLSQSKTRLTNAQNRMVRAKYDYIFRIKVLELFFGERPVE